MTHGSYPSAPPYHSTASPRDAALEMIVGTPSEKGKTFVSSKDRMGGTGLESTPVTLPCVNDLPLDDLSDFAGALKGRVCAETGNSLSRRANW